MHRPVDICSKNKSLLLKYKTKACMIMSTLQTSSLYRLQGSPCVVILSCKDPVKITGYHSKPSSYVVGTKKNCNQYREIPVHWTL